MKSTYLIFNLLFSITILELNAYSDHKKMCLGVKTQPLPEWAAEQLGLRYGEGLLIKHILDNSPAEKAGLQNNDIITKADEHIVGTPALLREIICDKQALDTIQISLIRQGKPMNIEVTLDHNTFKLDKSISSHEPHHKKPSLLDDSASHDEARHSSLSLPAHPSQKQLRQQMRQQMQAFQQQINQLFNEESYKKFADLKKQMQQDFEAFRASRNDKLKSGFHSSQASSFQFMDSEGVIKIETQDNQQTIIICDQDNHILYKGPYPQNQEDWGNMDESAKNRLLKLDLTINPDTGLVTAQLFN